MEDFAVAMFTVGVTHAGKNVRNKQYFHTFFVNVVVSCTKASWDIVLLPDTTLEDVVEHIIPGWLLFPTYTYSQVPIFTAELLMHLYTDMNHQFCQRDEHTNHYTTQTPFIRKMNIFMKSSAGNNFKGVI